MALINMEEIVTSGPVDQKLFTCGHRDHKFLCFGELFCVDLI